MAYELQAAKTKQRLKEEEMQIQVVERAQQILVQEQEILRKEKELDAKVRRPAEAERTTKLESFGSQRTLHSNVPKLNGSEASD